MRLVSKSVPPAGIQLLFGLVALVFIAGSGATAATLLIESFELEASLAQAPAAAPRFVYSSGPQGFGYYANPAVQAAPQPRPATNAGTRNVGPGARNWATGNRSSLHRPWLRSR